MRTRTAIIELGRLALTLGLVTTAQALPPTITDITMAPRLTIESEIGTANRIEYKTNLAQSFWMTLTTRTVVESPYWLVDAAEPPVRQSFYRVANDASNNPPHLNISSLPLLKIESDVGTTNQIQFTIDQVQTPWTTLTNIAVVQSPYWFADATATNGSQRFYRVLAYPPNNPPPSNMALIPAGLFQMGDNLDGLSDALPVHTVDLSAFYMDKFEVTKTLWDEVYQWALTNGYNLDHNGQAVSANHPVHSVSWQDAVKWCNARSEREGRVPAYYTSVAHTTPYRNGQINPQSSWVQWDAGYRLPTEAEWERAARGGTDGNRFPWSVTNTIAQSQANYFSFWQNGQAYYSYDVSSTSGYQPLFSTGEVPHTSPAGFFAPNGYGLYDMAGNVWEWCGDWWSDSYYSSSPGNDPLGAGSGLYRVVRGGSWATYANGCRTANRGNATPDTALTTIGFRTVLTANQP